MLDGWHVASRCGQGVSAVERCGRRKLAACGQGESHSCTTQLPCEVHHSVLINLSGRGTISAEISTGPQHHGNVTGVSVNGCDVHADSAIGRRIESRVDTSSLIESGSVSKGCVGRAGRSV
jgi:hypothetical protein